MLTNDDLKKLQTLVEKVVDKRAEETELKMESRFNAVDKRLHDMEKQMVQDRRDWSQFFNHAGIFFDEMRSQLVKRIEKLEDKERLAKN